MSQIRFKTIPHFVTNLESIRKYPDVLLFSTEGSRYGVHSSLLATHSEHMTNILKENMVTGEEQLIIRTEITSDDLAAILK